MAREKAAHHPDGDFEDLNARVDVEGDVLDYVADGLLEGWTVVEHLRVGMRGGGVSGRRGGVRGGAKREGREANGEGPGEGREEEKLTANVSNESTSVSA